MYLLFLIFLFWDGYDDMVSLFVIHNTPKTALRCLICGGRTIVDGVIWQVQQIVSSNKVVSYRLHKDCRSTR